MWPRTLKSSQGAAGYIVRNQTLGAQVLYTLGRKPDINHIVKPRRKSKIYIPWTLEENSTDPKPQILVPGKCTEVSDLGVWASESALGGGVKQSGSLAGLGTPWNVFIFSYRGLERNVLVGVR